MNHSYLEYTPPNPDQNYPQTSGSSLKVNIRFKGAGEKIISIGVLLKTSLIGEPLSLETPIEVSLYTPRFYWRPKAFHWRPRAFHWRPHIFVEDPKLFIGDPKISNEKIGVSNETSMGVFNERGVSNGTLMLTIFS